MATDVASKGLDFPNIQHVINYDLPDEIENYVHRIGRTGRSGKTGIATTFINKNQGESILLDLKHLLKEAKQRIPPVLLVWPRQILIAIVLFSYLLFEYPLAYTTVVCRSLHGLCCILQKFQGQIMKFAT